MTSDWEIFKLLMWKNYLVQVRKFWTTLCEILLPITCCSLLIIMRLLIKREVYDQASKFSPIQPEKFDIFLDNINTSEVLNSHDTEKYLKVIPQVLYSPQNVFVDEIMSNVEDEIAAFASVSATNDSLELENKMMSGNYYVGLEFPDEYKHLKTLPHKLQCKIRFPGITRSSAIQLLNEANWKTQFLYPYFPLTKVRVKSIDHDEVPSYYKEGFLVIQSLIFEAFVKARNESILRNLPNILVQKFPFPSGYEDRLLEILRMVLPVAVNTSFLFLCVNIVKHMIVEKEKKLTKMMKIMGVKPHLHYITWFLKSFIYLLIISTLITILLKFSFLLPNTSTSVLFVFFIIYSITTIILAFLMLSVFKKSSTATALTSLIFLFEITPYTASCDNAPYADLSRTRKLILSLMHNYALSVGLRNIVVREAHDGAQWSNIFEDFNDNVNLGEMMVMIVLDAILYVLGIVVVGMIRRKFSKRHHSKEKYRKDSKEAPITCNSFITVKNLTKIYQNSTKPAVDSINMSLDEGQIVVLLGTNGAGKSTTMSMLCGETKPTSGTIIADGYEAGTERLNYKSIGIAFQDNILFSKLTVHEHLIFYGRLKGNAQLDAERESQNFTKILNLNPNDLACNLSGGMKRKLCMAIAICANSKLVILDEISSGVDPASRRDIWNFLQSMKKNRVILMSTHYMLEAEVIADKIAILCEGKLKAFGGPYELKQKFSRRCKLICLMRSEVNDSIILAEFLNKFVPNVKVISGNGMELCFGFHIDDVEKMSGLLMNLEDHAEELNVESFGIAFSSIEEVLERVDDTMLDYDSPRHLQTISPESTEESKKNTTSYDIMRLSQKDFTLFFAQIKALLIKKFIIMYRNYKITTLQVFLSSISIFLSIFFGPDGQFVLKNQPVLDLSTQSYPNSLTFVHFNTESESFLNLSIIKNLNINHMKIEGTDMEAAFLKNSQTNFDLNYKSLFGISANAMNVTGWFNGQALHTMPIALNLVHNVLLNAVFGNESGIDISNKPLPYKEHTKDAAFSIIHSTNEFQKFFSICFGLSIVQAMLIISIIKERTSNSKSMQFMTGIHPLNYWLSIFILDLLLTIIIATLTSIVIIITTYNQPASNVSQFLRFFVVIMAYGTSVLPIVYVFSFIFGSPVSGFLKSLLMYLFFGNTLFGVYLGMHEFAEKRMILKKIFENFIIFPPFNFCDTMRKINDMDNRIKICDMQCKYFDVCGRDNQCINLKNCCNTDYFSWSSDGILWNLLYFLITFIIFIYILFILESKLISSIFHRLKSTILKFPFKFPSTIRKFSFESNTNIFNLDPDVEAERRKVANLTELNTKEYNLVLKDLTKIYLGRTVVKGLSFGVKSGECFGLLGANGAGKTTTFRMMIKDLQSTSGEVYIRGSSSTKNIHNSIGYCGQFDAFMDELTGRETLNFYANSHSINTDILQLARNFDFLSHLDKQIRFYSGGTKRKLSAAVALIGDPQIIFLDEPTSFMDPLGKRKFWHQITKLRDSGKTILLSSHSMDEVEVLCTRVGIMMNGELKCLGSPQYLKDKFGKTIVVSLKLKKMEVSGNERDEVKRMMDRKLKGAVLKEEYNDMLIYHLASKSYKWSHIFKVIEMAKEKISIIEDFTVNQSNLIQVFLQVTRDN